MKVSSRKEFTFDLDTKALRKYYPNKNWRNAYNDIRAFMKKENFIHRQGSCYNSINKLQINQVVTISKRLTKTFPWLKKCVNKFDVTDIGEQHDLSHIISGKPKTKVQEIEKQAEKSAYMPRSKLEAQAQKLHNTPQRTPTKSKSKNNEIK